MEESKAPYIRQIIVMRYDLKMRRGKQIAQGAHASMPFSHVGCRVPNRCAWVDFSPNAQTWIIGAFAKVCDRCNSEEELMVIHDKAVEMGFEVHHIIDSSRAEFHGQPTRTCLAIGPDGASMIDQVTGHLELL